jgi:hypothetical protein
MTRTSAAGPDLKRGETGFAYLVLLGFVAVAGIGLAALAQVWSTAAQREREAELLFIGHQSCLALVLSWPQIALWLPRLMR